MNAADAVALCGSLGHIRYVAGVARRLARSAPPGSSDWSEWSKTRRNYLVKYLLLRACRKGGRA